jgi:hypothetical protein
MEINRASTLAKVLARDRALEARDRKDAAIEKGRLADNDAYPGSKKFPQAVEVIAQYLADLVDAKVSSIRDAHAQTGTPLTGQTVADAMEALHTSLETVMSARVGSWGGSLALVQTRTRETVTGGAEALAEAERELRRQSARLYEKAEAKLDVLLQSSLAASEKRERPSNAIPPKLSRTATVLRVLIASPSDVVEHREVLTNVIMDWNATHSAAEGIVLMPVKWETHAHPATGDYPQGLINKQIVDDCDILIGAFWSRLGTATPVAPSGTAEEIERLRSKGKNVLLYFSEAPLPQSHDPEQWRMLKDYQQTLRKDTLYWNFSTPEELYRLASRHLAAVIHEISAELGEGLSIEAAPPVESSKDASTDLPAAKPIIVPKRYGGGNTKDDFGYTGLGVVNDGEQPGYDLTIHDIQLADGTKLVFHRGHTERLTKTDGEAFYPAVLEARLGGTFGSALFNFMRERGIPSITVPITYRDSDNNWFQTDVTFERDVQKSGGLRLGWTQKRIPEPTPESA